MGFACPVCEIPHQDATHLANHLAFTAMTHGDDHEAWLDDHVPEWAEFGEDNLAAAVADLAPEAAYDQVFEDTVHAHSSGGTHQHEHHDSSNTDRTTRQQQRGVDPEAAAAMGGGALDEEARAVLDEARGLTTAMLDEASDAEDDTNQPGESDGDTEN
jgi:hypothetical protein